MIPHFNSLIGFVISLFDFWHLLWLFCSFFSFASFLSQLVQSTRVNFVIDHSLILMFVI